MLNKGLRDQESERIDNVLKTLLSLVYVPKKATDEDIINIENQLKALGLNIESLIEIEPHNLIELLGRLHFDWNQREQFAGFLIAFSKDNPFDLKEKAISIYEHIQSESKTFSFGIFNKIALAKANS
ncbi:hypothetical protein H4V97_001876 [Flavobacterium sp. CG_23.5]|uniref:hypothetical protein n=1 Tax=unclassified Flavobacterium TaxID=196869 RepID=UPI0018C910A2|nr:MULTISPECIES: hypothetical protein [unclassified Flavobacterium]MBG6109178.1 hypothetical protein [Flavobacterium sp. CG_9.10]MBP2283558.1 hypothetical protein [Flavobacterium sp. CG_23.5]